MEITKEDESQESDLHSCVRVSGITPSDFVRPLALSVPGIGYPLERDEIIAGIRRTFG
jgi:hypothetical protein